MSNFHIEQTGMDSTNVYAYISIIALLVCIPPALFVSLVDKIDKSSSSFFDNQTHFNTSVSIHGLSD